MRLTVTLKRAYDPAGRGDGPRVLVDRVWPRGVSKERLKAVAWLKGARAEHRTAQVVRPRLRQMADLPHAVPAGISRERGTPRGTCRIRPSRKADARVRRGDPRNNQTVVIKEMLEKGRRNTRHARPVRGEAR